MRYSIIFLLLLLSTASWTQEAVLVDSLVQDSVVVKTETAEQKIRRLEDSLLVEKIRREERHNQSKGDEEKVEAKIKTALEDPGKAIGGTVDNVADDVGETVNTFTNILNPSKIITALVVFIFTWLLVRAVNWFFNKLINQFPNRRLEIKRIQPIITVLIWAIAIFALIRTLFETKSILAAATGSAVALGFALQDVIKNIFGGLLILLNRPFQVGDKVNIKGTYGEVKKIGLQTTFINTSDDNLVSVPNAAIVNESVSNANAGALDCMVVVNLWLPVDIDVELVRNLAFESAITSRYLNIDKPVTVLFFDHFDQQAATNVQIKAYVLDARYEKRFEGDITEAAKNAFAEAGLYG